MSWREKGYEKVSDFKPSMEILLTSSLCRRQIVTKYLIVFDLKEAYFTGAVSSPHCYFKENTMMNPNSSNVEASFQPKPQEFVTVPPTAWTKPNKHSEPPKPFFQSQLPNTEQSSNKNNMVINAKLLQAQLSCEREEFSLEQRMLVLKNVTDTM
ncbi:LOW QUALITY PROTEIN: hypothetical protein YC2023_089428 [Brassica napus]